MLKQNVLVITIALIFATCTWTNGNRKGARSTETGVLFLRTDFFDSSGTVVFHSPMMIWYQDSAVIEEVVRIETSTDTASKTTVSYPVEVYKYFDLAHRNWFDYRTFTDTSRIVRSGILPDSLVRGTDWRGWAFYTNSVPMKGEPEVLADTIIRGTKYMRVKFSKLNRPSGYYSIGYLRYDNKGKLFSLNKNFSSKVNCTMTRYDEFKETGLAPFATTELEFLSDTLSANELRVFQAWKENAKKDNNY